MRDRRECLCKGFLTRDILATPVAGKRRVKYYVIGGTASCSMLRDLPSLVVIEFLRPVARIESSKVWLECLFGAVCIFCSISFQP